MDTSSLEHWLERAYCIRRHLLPRGGYPYNKNNFRHYWFVVKTQMIEELLKIGGGIGVGAAVIYGLAKSGILKISIGKNGNGVEAQLKIIEENHLAHIEEKLEKLVEQNQEILFIVRELKK